MAFIEWTAEAKQNLNAIFDYVVIITLFDNRQNPENLKKRDY